MFRVFYLGGKQAGCVGLLTLLAAGHNVRGAMPYDPLIATLIEQYQIRTVYPSIKGIGRLIDVDLIVCVHGRERVPMDLLNQLPYGGINVHPCLYRYSGVNPVGRLLQDGGRVASVGVHRMTKDIDMGETLVEEFINIGNRKTVEEVYNILYPLYTSTLLKALKIL